MLTRLIFTFVLVGICVVIHTIGMAALTGWLLRWRRRIERQSNLTTSSLVLIMVFAVVIFLHLVETTIWAVFYFWRALFLDFETAMYFSLKTYTTIGYGDVVLPERWRLFGGIEGLSGVLLCGLSTAFIFAIVNALFQIHLAERTKH